MSKGILKQLRKEMLEAKRQRVYESLHTELLQTMNQLTERQLDMVLEHGHQVVVLPEYVAFHPLFDSLLGVRVKM